MHIVDLSKSSKASPWGAASIHTKPCGDGLHVIELAALRVSGESSEAHGNHEN